jgi:hypothetical protein
MSFIPLCTELVRDHQQAHVRDGLCSVRTATTCHKTRLVPINIRKRSTKGRQGYCMAEKNRVYRVSRLYLVPGT